MNILLRDIKAKYGEKTILNEFCCEIKGNSINLLVGKSGSGKTTIINMLLGIKDDYQGEIIGLDNLNLSAVFQEDRLIESLSVHKNLRLICEDEAAIKEAIEKTDMGDVFDMKVKELSGGMKRRVAIIRALLTDYDLLIMDEPFVGIDKKTLGLVIEYIKKMSEGKTILIASHDENVYKYFDDINMIYVKENNCG